jgi:hypothetical protein
MDRNIIAPGMGWWGLPPAPRVPLGELPRPEVGDGYGDVLEAEVKARFPKERGNLIMPTPRQRDVFRAVVRGTLWGLHHDDLDHIERMRDMANDLGYDITPLKEGKDIYLQLKEMGLPTRGWGTVFFNVNARNGTVIEIPHPVHDFGTPEMGWRAFRQFGAETLIIAGAHRNNLSQISDDVAPGETERQYPISDPSHCRDTMFQAMHQGATSDESVVLQFHGFAADKQLEKTPEFDVSTQAVLTDGLDDCWDPPRLVASLARLTEAGYKSHIVTWETPALGVLSGISNVQKKDMVERGLLGRWRSRADFVHIEFDSTVRKKMYREENFKRVLTALKPIFTGEMELPRGVRRKPHAPLPPYPVKAPPRKFGNNPQPVNTPAPVVPGGGEAGVEPTGAQPGGEASGVATQSQPASGSQSPGSQTPGPQSPGPQPPGPLSPGPQSPGSQPAGPQPPGSQPPGPQSPGSQPPDVSGTGAVSATLPPVDAPRPADESAR